MGGFLARKESTLPAPNPPKYKKQMIQGYV